MTNTSLSFSSSTSPTKTVEATMASSNINTTVVMNPNSTKLASAVDSTDFMHQSEAENMRDFYIGLMLAVSSSVFIGSSFIFKKLGLLRLARNSQGVRAGDGGYGYLKEWLWWAGMILMIVGEFANFAAYAFAPATLVTPLGALSVITSAVLASKFLEERLNLLGKIGCGLALIGSTLMVLHSPKEQEIASMEELQSKLLTPIFIIFIILVVIVSLVLIFFVGPRWGHKYVVIYVSICSTLGCFTVMGCKGLGVAIKETAKGRNEFANWLTWILLFVVLACILVQLNFLNKALDMYNTAVVTPTYYVFFTTTVIVASIILFQEWGHMEGSDVVGDLCGFLVIVAGIFQLNAFKHMNVTLKTLPKAQKVDLASANGEALTGLEGETEFLVKSDPNSNTTLPLGKVKEYHDDDSASEDFTRDDIGKGAMIDRIEKG